MTSPLNRPLHARREQQDPKIHLDWIDPEKAISQLQPLLPASTSATHILAHFIRAGEIRVATDHIELFDPALTDDGWSSGLRRLDRKEAACLNLINVVCQLDRGFWSSAGEDWAEERWWNWSAGDISTPATEDQIYHAHGCRVSGRDVEALKVTLLLGKLDTKPFRTRKKRGRSYMDAWAPWIGEVVAMVNDGSIRNVGSPNKLIELSRARLIEAGTWGADNHGPDRTTLYDAAKEICRRLGITAERPS